MTGVRCSSGAMVSGDLGGRQARFELVHRRQDVLAVLMRVAFHHRGRLPSANALHSGQVHARLHQVRRRRVPKSVPHDLRRIQAGSSGDGRAARTRLRCRFKSQRARVFEPSAGLPLGTKLTP